MRNYLSFGGGVNSVALHLLLLDQGVDFEPVFIHHGTDWPETYHYVAGFQWWLKKNCYPSIVILKPDVGTVEGQRFDNLYNYYQFKKNFPCRISRGCTDKFKLRTLQRYQKHPAFVFIGYAADEAHRAKISTSNGFEYRWPLIEQDITRAGCIEIIKSHGLPIPRKSGCFICPYQPTREWKELRRVHPELFCKATTLENQYVKRRKAEGKKPLYIKDKPLSLKINENQNKLFPMDKYPPCECGL